MNKFEYHDKKSGAPCAVTETIIEKHKQNLSILAVQATEILKEPNFCTVDTRRRYSLKNSIGQRVYADFSDGELLDILIATMHNYGHKPCFEEVYCIY